MARKKNIYKVGEYYYDDKQVAIKAEEELRAADYMKAQLKGADSATVFEIYESLLGQHSFETEVGMELLEAMYNYLSRFATYKTKLEPLYHYDKRAVAPPKEEPDQPRKAEKKTSGVQKKAAKSRAKKPSQVPSGTHQGALDDGFNYKAGFRIMTLATAILLICVLFMCIVANSTDNITILNYEEKLIDRYSAWEKQLSEKEEELKLWESELASRAFDGNDELVVDAEGNVVH